MKQIAVVTGASQGIGRAVAEELARRTYHVCAVARQGEVLREITRAHPDCMQGHEIDLRDDNQIGVLGRDLRSDFGQVDALVHCAGIYISGNIQDTFVGDLDNLYRINVRATYLLTQELLPLMRARGGNVVFVNSSTSLRAGLGNGPYSATQHARRAIADSLRQEVNAMGIRVLNIFSGRTATPMMEAIYRDEAREYVPKLLLQPHDIAIVIANALEMSPTTELTDIQVRPAIKSY